MKWCNVQTNKNDLQAKMYPTNCTYNKLHNNNENEFPVFPECICNTWQNMMQKISGTQPRKNMTTMGKVDTSDLIMIITWAMDTLLITYTEMGQLNTLNPIYYDENKR